MWKRQSLHISLLQSCEHQGDSVLYKHFVATGLRTRSDSVRVSKGLVASLSNSLISRQAGAASGQMYHALVCLSQLLLHD